jgi:deoxyguanosine kinase
MQLPRYIVVEGNIGAGKTSLAHLLARHFDGDLLLEEFAENTFLPQFYNDPERFAFPLEMSFMAERYRHLKLRLEQPVNGKPIISDYLFDKSLLFARVNLKNKELELFESFYKLIKDSIRKPDLLIYLKKEVGYLKKNIEQRGRDFEKEIKEDYLTDLNQSYDFFVTANTDINKLVIDSNHIDFINNKSDLESIIEKISSNHL